MEKRQLNNSCAIYSTGQRPATHWVVENQRHRQLLFFPSPTGFSLPCPPMSLPLPKTRFSNNCWFALNCFSLLCAWRSTHREKSSASQIVVAGGFAGKTGFNNDNVICLLTNTSILLVTMNYCTAANVNFLSWSYHFLPRLSCKICTETILYSSTFI